MRAVAGSLRRAFVSFRLPLEAFQLLRRERSLWPLAGAPLGLSLLAVGGSLAAVLGYESELRVWIAELLPSLEAGAWYTWLWVGPGRVLLRVAGVLLFFLVLALSLVGALLLANILAAPFHELLSRRVEALVTGVVEEAQAGSWWEALRDALRAVGQELRRVIFFLAVTGALLALGLFVPGGQLVAPPALTLFTISFLPLDYAGFVLDRRRLSFRDKRRWLARHAPATLAFGSSAFLTCALPVLNLAAMPVLVVAGTLHALRCDPGPPAPGEERRERVRKSGRAGLRGSR